MKELLRKPGSDDLSKMLQEWRNEHGLPPGFETAVWRRIDAQTATVKKTIGRSLIEWLNQFVARPQVALATIALLIMVGVTAGWTQGQREVSRVQDQLSHKYLASLDPYQPPR